MSHMKTTNENLFGETLCLGGVPVVGFGDVGPTDLFMYRRMWEPFIAEHLALWRALNDNLENSADTQKCPAGVFTSDQIANLEPALRAFCNALSVTRARVGDTPDGILPQWNLWSGKSSSEILAAAAVMLKQQQDVVARVAGSYKDDLLKIAKYMGIAIQLPPVPSFSTQQSVISQIEGAYTTVQGVLQIAGYGTGSTLVWVGNQTKAATEGLTDTIKGAGEAVRSSWTWIGIAAVLAVVGGVLVVYYVPRSKPERKEAA